MLNTVGYVSCGLVAEKIVQISDRRTHVTEIRLKGQWWFKVKL